MLLIATTGQLFCTTACLTSASRMLFAFSRDGAVPGAKHWAKLNASKTPVNAVLAVRVAGLILTLPALWKVNIGTPEAPIYTVTAFFAIVSIGVLGLYLAFAIPIYYRWQAGDSFKQGSWNLGTKWKWMAPLAIAEILITSVYFILPLYPAGAPGFMRGFLGAPTRPRCRSTGSSSTTPRSSSAPSSSRCGSAGTSRPSTGSPDRSTRSTCPPGVSSADEIALEHHEEGLLPGEHHRHDEP